MATAGHFVTLLGVLFFFMMIADSHVEKKIFVTANMGLPRWHKRILYYIFKIRYLQFLIKNVKVIPNSTIRLFLSKPYFNEYEVYVNK